MRILIADGDKALLEQTQRYLLQHGHDVKSASDGLECTDILYDFIPDVVVLDCDLLWGGSDGVIALMRHHPNLSQTPIILIAEEDPRAEFDDTLNAALVGWLPRPYRLSELLTQIEIGSRSLRFAKPGQGSLILESSPGGNQ